jgi:hypothetical protein
MILQVPGTFSFPIGSTAAKNPQAGWGVSLTFERKQQTARLVGLSGFTAAVFGIEDVRRDHEKVRGGRP